MGVLEPHPTRVPCHIRGGGWDLGPARGLGGKGGGEVTICWGICLGSSAVVQESPVLGGCPFPVLGLELLLGAFGAASFFSSRSRLYEAKKKTKRVTMASSLSGRGPQPVCLPSTLWSLLALLF